MRTEFDLESELLDVLHAKTLSGDLFSRRNADLLVLPQIEVGAAIPDLVIVRRAGRPKHDASVRLTMFESWIVGELLRGGYVREATLTRRLFTRQTEITAALRRLERRGVIKKTATGTYWVRTDFSGRFEVLSIEAKLHRWKMAVDQALSYLRFSDLAYIALPASVIAANEQIVSTCCKTKIGVIAVKPNRIEVVLSARANEPDLRDWTWLLAKTGSLQL